MVLAPFFNKTKEKFKIMKIEEIEVSVLLPYSRNAKKHDTTQIDNVAQSIKQFGFIQPVVIDKDNKIIIGHCRTLAAEQLEIEKVPCIRMEDLTEEQANKLRLLDNKLNESEWDLYSLKQQVEELDFSDFELDWDLPAENDISLDELGDLFEDAESKPKEPKTIKCPHCGELIEI